MTNQSKIATAAAGGTTFFITNQLDRRTSR